MEKNMKWGLVFLCGVFLSGCGVNPLVHNIKSHDVDEGSGVLVGSVAKAENLGEFLEYGFWIEKTDHGYSRSIKIDNRSNLFNWKPAGPDFVTDIDSGRVFALPFPPGEYRIADVRMDKIEGQMLRTMRSRKEFAIPVTIHPGKYNYLGEMRMVKISVPDRGGRRYFTVWVLSDQKDRDLSLLKEKYPKVGIQDALSVIPETEVKPTPLVIIPAELDELIKNGLIVELGEKTLSSAD